MANNFNYVLMIHSNDNVFFPFYSSNSLKVAKNVRWIVCNKVDDERWQVNRKKVVEFLTLNCIPSVDAIVNKEIPESPDWKMVYANMVGRFENEEKYDIPNLWEMLLIKVPALNLNT